MVGGDPDLVDTEEAQAESEDDPDHDDEEGLALELLPPALSGEGRKAREHDEDRQNSSGEGEPQTEDPTVILARLLDEAQDLDADHGKHAGHEVEDEARHEPEEDVGEEGAGALGGLNPVAPPPGRCCLRSPRRRLLVPARVAVLPDAGLRPLRRQVRREPGEDIPVERLGGLGSDLEARLSVEVQGNAGLLAGETAQLHRELALARRPVGDLSEGEEDDLPVMGVDPGGVPVHAHLLRELLRLGEPHLPEGHVLRLEVHGRREAHRVGGSEHLVVEVPVLRRGRDERHPEVASGFHPRPLQEDLQAHDLLLCAPRVEDTAAQGSTAKGRLPGARESTAGERTVREDVLGASRWGGRDGGER